MIEPVSGDRGEHTRLRLLAEVACRQRQIDAVHGGVEHDPRMELKETPWWRKEIALKWTYLKK